MDIKLKICGVNHLDSATGYMNLGNFFRDKKDFATAEQYYKTALAIIEVIIVENVL